MHIINILNSCFVNDLKNSPILWLSRRQNTVETSTFGSEFVALRPARDMIVAMRYKLRMFGVPLEGPAQVFCDNQGVVKNTSSPYYPRNTMRLTTMRYVKLLQRELNGLVRKMG